MRLLITMLFLFTISEFVQAQNDDIEQTKSNTETATIIIYRTGQFFGAGANFSLHDGDQKICKLSNNKYLVYQRAPGTAQIHAKMGGLTDWPKKKTGLSLPVEAGETYYIKAEQKRSITRARVELTEVTIRAGKKGIEGMGLDRCSQ